MANYLFLNQVGLDYPSDVLPLGWFSNAFPTLPIAHLFQQPQQAEQAEVLQPGPTLIQCLPHKACPQAAECSSDSQGGGMSCCRYLHLSACLFCALPQNKARPAPQALLPPAQNKLSLHRACISFTPWAKQHLSSLNEEVGKEERKYPLSALTKAQLSAGPPGPRTTKATLRNAPHKAQTCRLLMRAAASSSQSCSVPSADPAAATAQMFAGHLQL